MTIKNTNQHESTCRCQDSHILTPNQTLYFRVGLSLIHLKNESLKQQFMTKKFLVNFINELSMLTIFLEGQFIIQNNAEYHKLLHWLLIFLNLF